VTSAVPFAYLAHVLTIPVTVCDVETTFIFDTGRRRTIPAVPSAGSGKASLTPSNVAGRRGNGHVSVFPGNQQP
jgi:hypothetical protein